MISIGLTWRIMRDKIRNGGYRHRSGAERRRSLVATPSQLLAPLTFLRRAEFPAFTDRE